MSQLKRVTATGDVAAAGTGGGARVLRSVVLTPAAAAATLDVRDGSGGAIIASLQAAANGNSAIWSVVDRAGVPFTTAIHATIAGASASATFEYE